MLKLSKKIIITGGDGMVASQADFGVKLTHKELDILKPASIEKAIQKYKPDTILHLAAMTNMLECQKNPKAAYQTNVLGTCNIAAACKTHNIKLVYLSTCAVFDGKKLSAYKITDAPNPLNIYGTTKWLGEIIAKDLAPNSLIIRTGWLFGGGSNIDTKFAYKVFKVLKENREVKATSDRVGSPTYIKDLLEAIQELIKKDAKGIFHIVNKGTASYFEIAKEIKKAGKFSALVKPLKAHKIENKQLKRGKMEGLAQNIPIRSWKAALKEYIETSLS